MGVLQEAKAKVWYKKLKIYGIGARKTRLVAEVMAKNEIDTEEYGGREVPVFTNDDELLEAIKDLQYNQGVLKNG